MDNDSINTTISYDTLGVEIVFNSSKRTVVIDKFNADFKILKQSVFPAGSEGIVVDFTVDGLLPEFLSIMDSLIKGEKYLVSSFNVKNKSGSDSLSGHLYWKKMEQFNSIFSLSRKDTGNNKLVSCGFDLLYHKEMYQLKMQILNIQRLSFTDTEKCRKIIKSLIKRTTK